MERVIQETDNDAFACKISAVTKKYLPSPEQVKAYGCENFEEIHMEFCQTLKGMSRRKYGKVYKTCQQSFPVMNYGTYLRSLSIDFSILKFLKERGSVVNEGDMPIQVINLGCGSDLRMIQFLQKFSNMLWIDVDYRDIVSLKSKVLSQNEKLRALLGIGSISNFSGLDCIDTNHYKLFPCDLTKEDQVLALLEKFADPKIPTVLISECVLCYLTDANASKLIRTIQNFFQEGFWVSYDPIGGSEENDRFGSIMLENLRESRQLSMPTLMVYNSKEKYSCRFKGKKQIETMWEYYQNSVEESEKRRLKTLQFLDEIEELRVIFSHYVVCSSYWDEHK